MWSMRHAAAAAQKHDCSTARHALAWYMLADLLLPQAIRILNMIKVWAKPIRVNKSSQDKRAADVGANLFIGNLDPDVDEKVGC